MPSNIISDLAQSLWQQHVKEVTCHITKSPITEFQRWFDEAVFHCEDKQASSLRIFCPCLYFQAIETTFMDASIFATIPQEHSRTTRNCDIAGFSTPSPIREVLPMGHWQRTSTPIWIYPGQEEKIVSKWSPHHLLRGLAIPTDAQHLGQINIPTHSGGVPRPLRVRRYTLFVPSCRQLRLMETSFSSGKTWLVSSPALTKHDSLALGICSWTSLVPA